MGRRGALLAGLVLAACRTPAPRQDAAEAGTLIVNAEVFGRPGADAVLLRGGRIAAVGRRVDLEPGARRARRLDARRGLLAPGLHDAHVHLLSGGMALLQLDLTGLKTAEEVARAVRRYAEEHPEEPYVIGRGWSYDIVPAGQFPSRHALDAAVPGRPVLLESYDGHSYWVNSAALERAGIGPDTPEPPKGRIVREPASRQPQGVLLDAEDFLLSRAGVAPSRARKRRALEAALRYMAESGFASADAIIYDLEEIELLEEIDRAGRLPIRVNVCPPLDGDLAAYAALRRRLRDGRPGGGRLRFGFLKGFVDGVIESKTAYMLEPYAGSEERGKPLIAPERLQELVVRAHANGFRVALHAIGDGAVRLALDAYEEAARRRPELRVRHRIEHLEVVHDDDLARLKRLGVVASMQPRHADPGGPEPDDGVWSANLGPERLKLTFPWRALLDHGAVLAFGSDWPVMSADPLAGLAVAATRQDREGRPEAGWNAHQAVSLEEALAAYTRGPAYALGRETEQGRIGEGFLADLTLFSRQLRLDDAASPWRARVERVLVGGETAFSR